MPWDKPAYNTYITHIKYLLYIKHPKMYIALIFSNLLRKNQSGETMGNYVKVSYLNTHTHTNKILMYSSLSKIN